MKGCEQITGEIIEISVAHPVQEIDEARVGLAVYVP